MGLKGFEGGIASVVAGCATHPGNLLKVRMQLHGEPISFSAAAALRAPFSFPSPAAVSISRSKRGRKILETGEEPAGCHATKCMDRDAHLSRFRKPNLGTAEEEREEGYAGRRVLRERREKQREEREGKEEGNGGRGGKNSHLKSFKEAPENLQLFQAELLDYDALSAAISGCEGVFHAATPIPSAKVPNPELDVIAPAVTGTLNILKACTEAKVKRVVIVSSTAAVQVNPGWPQDRIKDEDCWSDKEFCKKIENWYCLSKTMAEEAAWEYAKENEIDVITVCPSMVFGPLLQPTVNVSSSFLISIIQGGREPTENILFHFADVRDVADALLLVYEKPEASGRYICAPHPSNLGDLVEKLKNMYPNYNYQSYTEADQDALMTSEKLKRLGWNCRTLEETLTDTVEYYRDIGLLETN